MLEMETEFIILMLWYATTHFPGKFLSRLTGEWKWPQKQGERESGVLVSDSWCMKDDFAKTLNMSSIHLLPDQAPTDFEKLLHSLPSYMWHKEAVSCWLTKARVIKVNSTKTADVARIQGNRACGSPTAMTGVAMQVCATQVH